MNDRKKVIEQYYIDKIEQQEKKYQKLKNNIDNKILDLSFKTDFNSWFQLVLNKLLRKKKLNIVYISDNKEIMFKYIFYDSKNYFNINDKSYTFNETHFYMYKNNPILFIYENQPIPFIFSKETEIDSSILNDIMKSKFISELLQRDTGIFGMKLDKNVVMIVAIIAIGFFLFTQGFFNDIFSH